MKLTNEIFLFLSNHPGNYKNLRQHVLGDQFLEERLEKMSAEKKEARSREKVLKSTLHRLKKNGLIKDDKQIWHLTADGVRKLKNQIVYNKHSPPPQTIETARKVIIAFDIPENKKKSRYWLRIELTGQGFKLLQKSVWLGPAPLPKEFIDHLKTMDLLPHLKFFEVKETEII